MAGKRAAWNGLQAIKEQTGRILSVRQQSSAMPAAQTTQPEEDIVSTPSAKQPISNSIPFKQFYTQDKCNARRDWVQKFSNCKEFKYISHWWDGKDTDTEVLKGNIEMPIGTITMPLGIAGPIPINGENAKGEFLVPLATTEGALIASINRGAAALAQSEGVYTCAGEQRITRCPVFRARNAAEAVKIGDWITSKKDEIQEKIVTKHSRHAVLKDIFPIYDAELVHMLFVYQTADAAGQNASTSCTWHALIWIRENMPEELEVISSYIDGNLSGDKKGNNFNSVIGRGTSVMSKANISEEVLNKVLKIDSDSLVDIMSIIHRIGERTNNGGGNANISNVLGAVFAATGQDIACVNEASFARTSIEKNYSSPNGGVTASIFLPSLLIGTVGGGTSLPTQAECLGIMGCQGAGKAKKYAEIVATYCLALDISTAAALATDRFASAHDNLGRNRPDAK